MAFHNSDVKVQRVSQFQLQYLHCAVRENEKSEYIKGIQDLIIFLR